MLVIKEYNLLKSALKKHLRHVKRILNNVSEHENNQIQYEATKNELRPTPYERLQLISRKQQILGIIICLNEELEQHQVDLIGLRIGCNKWQRLHRDSKPSVNSAIIKSIKSLCEGTMNEFSKHTKVKCNRCGSTTRHIGTEFCAFFTPLTEKSLIVTAHEFTPLSHMKSCAAKSLKYTLTACHSYKTYKKKLTSKLNSLELSYRELRAIHQILNRYHIHGDKESNIRIERINGDKKSKIWEEVFVCVASGAIRELKSSLDLELIRVNSISIPPSFLIGLFKSVLEVPADKHHLAYNKYLNVLESPSYCELPISPGVQTIVCGSNAFTLSFSPNKHSKKFFNLSNVSFEDSESDISNTHESNNFIMKYKKNILEKEEKEESTVDISNGGGGRSTITPKDDSTGGGNRREYKAKEQLSMSTDSISNSLESINNAITSKIQTSSSFET